MIHRPPPDDIEVARADDGSFVVLGRPALRAVALSDLTDDDAVDYVQRRLRRLGWSGPWCAPGSGTATSSTWAR